MIMKDLRGKVKPEMVNKILKEKISGRIITR